jgi:Mn2+/Fe2+ NRAMP family transporter
MKASKFILIISIPCLLIVIGMDIYYNRGMIVSQSIFGDLIWFTVIPACLYFLAKRNEREESNGGVVK